jgi:hypothetical protein
MLEYHGQPGEHISNSAKRCLQMSQESGSQVRLIFNNVELVVDYHIHTAEQLVEQYDRERHKFWEEWRNSPAGEEAAREDERHRQEKQEEHDWLMLELMLVAGDEAQLMEWLASYSDAADHVGVEGKDFLRVCSVLELYGYVDNDCVGFPPESFEDPRTMARYIAGQAITCMRGGMPPHPVTQSFVERYKALPQKEMG